MLTINTAPTGFNCVHLPIVYEYSSDLFPTNTVDSPVAVTGFSDDNGYCRLTLFADIKATGNANELEFVKVEVDGVEDVYQIYNYYSDTDITIDLGYDAGFVFGDAQYYYSNYHGRFKIYAGLRTGHTYNSDKPTRLITEIRAVPDSSGVIKININEILKSDIDILGEGTYNNDITQFTEFYVDFAESYDQSLDGYTLVSYVSSYTDDSSNYAIAVNAKLPFRNAQGGSMSDYYSDAPFNGPSQFLEFVQTNSTIFVGFPYKVYWLNKEASTTLILKQYDNTDTLIQTDTFTYTDDEGVYQSDDLESYIISNAHYCTVEVPNDISYALTRLEINRECYSYGIYLKWRNFLGGMNYWLFTAEKDHSIEIESVKQSEEDIFINFPASYNNNATRIKYDTQRNARMSMLVRSQNLTRGQLETIKYIKTSPLVIFVQDNSANSYTYYQAGSNVLVDSASFLVYSESDKLYSISFNIQMTDTIPSQSL